MIQRSLLRQSAVLRASRTRPLATPYRFASPASRLRPAPLAASPRWYSAAAESEKPADADRKDGATEAAKSPDDEAGQKLEAKDKEITDLKDKYLRSVADFRNLQDRTRRDMESARDFAISRFAKDLVDSVDNLDRALSTVSETSLAADSTNKELKDLHGGLKMTESILMKTLEKHGLVRFDPSVGEEGKEGGQKFDPNQHDAAFMVKMDGKEDGTVFQTMQKGFMLNGRVIRAAKVGVVKNT